MTWDESGFHSIPASLSETWKRLYPRVNVEEELGYMHGWLLSNPSKRPKRCWSRFISGWLKRESRKVAKTPQKATTYALDPSQMPRVIVRG